MSSEQLGAAQNVLKGNLGGAWDITNGYQDAYTDLGIARRFGGSAAAYSLRDIGAMNGRVVKVRRDLAGEEADPEEDFSASQVDSGALENWVNGKLESTLPADVATAAAAYSLRKVKASYASNAVRIRRGSDEAEVNVAFDSDDKVSTSSDISVVSGSTTATDLNGFLNEIVSGFIATSYAGIDASYKHFTSDPTISNTAFSGANGGTQSRLTYQNPFGYLVSASDFDGCKVKVTGTVNTLSGGNITVKPNTQSNGGGSWTPSEGTKVLSTIGSFEYIFTGNGTNSFKSVAFLIDASTTVDVSNLTFEVIEHGATVHTWYDQAGSNNAVQTTAANQPKIAENGALLADGLDFDGSNDFLESTTLSSIYTGTDTVSSAFILVNSDAASTTQYIIGAGSTSASNPMYNTLFHSGGNIGWQARDDAGTLKSNLSATPYVANQMYLVSNINSGTTTDFNSNAVIIDNGADSDVGAKTINTVKLGARGNASSSPLNGSIKEAIFYASDQSNNRFKIESNINNYYGLYNDENEVTGAFTASGQDSFTANGTDGFTLGSATADAFAGIELNEKVPDNDIIYISFNANLSVTGTASPTVALRKTSISGTVSSDSPSSGQPAVIQGFNSFGLVCSDADAKFVTFLEDANNVAFTISDFRVSRIERNGFVPTWYDQSGNFRPLIQTNASEQPIIVENGLFLGAIKAEVATSNDTMQNLQVSTDGTNANFGTDDWADGGTKLGLMYVGSVISAVSPSSTSVLWGGGRGVSSFQSGGLSIQFIKAGTDSVRLRNERQGLTPSGTTAVLGGEVTGDAVIYGTADNRDFKIKVNDNSATDTEAADLDVREAAPLSLFGAYGGDNSRFYQRSSSGTCKECYLFSGDNITEVDTIATEINNHYNIY